MPQLRAREPERATNWEVLAGLRFFLAWVVLAGHLTWFSATPIVWADAFAAFGGKAAVVGFLLVSGYSIGASLSRSTTGFYRRRFLRIYPLYFFAILFGVVLEHAFHGHASVPGSSFEGRGWTTDIGNFFLLQTFVVKPIPFDGPVWSLSVEAFFYLIAPLLLRLRRTVLIAIVVVSAICYVLPEREGCGYAYYFVSRFNALKYLWCWLVGFLLWRDAGPTITLLAVACAPLMLAPATRSPLCIVTYGVSVAAIFLSSRLRVPARLRSVLDYLGDLSYPMYLFHLPTLILVYAACGVRSPEAIAAVALAVSVVALHVIDGYVKRKFFVPWVLPAKPAARPRGPGLRQEPGQHGRPVDAEGRDVGAHALQHGDP